MLPLIISSYPINQDVDIPLNSTIKVCFSEDIAEPTAGNVSLTNANRNEDVPFDITYDNIKFEISLEPHDPNALGINKLCGLTKYIICVKGIQSVSGGIQKNPQSLEFNTEAENVQDIVTPVQENVKFEAIRFYPKANDANISPTNVRVKFNKVVDESSVSAQTFFITTNEITSEDLDFIDLTDTLVDGELELETNEQVVTFTPSSAFLDNTEYYVVICNIWSNPPEGNNPETIEPIIYSFTSKYDPLYATLDDLYSADFKTVSSIIRDISKKDVYEMLSKNSQMAYLIAENASTEADIDWVTPAYFVKEYVKAKTRHDLLFDRYIDISTNANTKTLGDLTIQNSNSISDVGDLINILAREYKKWESMLVSIEMARASLGVFQKGSDIDVTQDFMNRQLRDLEGNKTGW